MPSVDGAAVFTGIPVKAETSLTAWLPAGRWTATALIGLVGASVKFIVVNVL